MNLFTSRQMIVVCVLSMGVGALLGPPMQGAAQPPEASGTSEAQPLETPSASESGRTTRAVGTITGQGGAGYISKFTGANAIGNSALFESSGKVGLGTKTPSAMFSANSSTNNVAAITGTHSNVGIGVFGQSANSDGVLGHSSSGAGVRGRHIIGTGTAPGVSGETNSISDGAKGVQGIVQSTTPGVDSAGVRGINNGTRNNGAGVYGSHAGSGAGVYGSSQGGNGIYGSSSGGYGVYGNSPYNAGVLGISTNGRGVYGSSTNSNGVYGVSQEKEGVYGYSYKGTGVYGTSASGLAGFFQGNVLVTGNLVKASGSFKIDHPQHPATEYLSHSFVESPDMMNVYNGNATTDEKGEAWVTMPSYFQALNREFRYQLTPMGQFAQAIVGKKISGNRFLIRTDKPNVEVSWMVTGIRNDAYARANRIRVEENKLGGDQGKYLYPAGFGFGKDKQIGAATPPRLVKR